MGKLSLPTKDTERTTNKTKQNINKFNGLNILGKVSTR